ncbi:MAG: hypothetical protein GXN93_03250 [Candidatus Diapherotrites archaeon]|nr:hypothetical protein [Candidatus Diapherotrites archaeon]
MIETKIERRASQLRCYQCGSEEIHAVCHHCGRPMCRKHGPVRPVLWWLTENREFSRLPLGQTPFEQTEGAHCADCVHSSPNYRRIFLYPGILLFILGLGFTFYFGRQTLNCWQHRSLPVSGIVETYSEAMVDPAVYQDSGAQVGCYLPTLVEQGGGWVQALLVSLLGVVMTGMGWYLNRERVAADLAGWRPPVPLGPVTDRIVVTEEWHFRHALDKNGHVNIKFVSAEGEVLPGWQFTALDRQRVQAYLKKYNLSLSKNRVPYNAGFLWLKGRPAWRRLFSKSGQVHRYSDTLLWLKGEVAQVPFVVDMQESDSRWPVSISYQVVTGLLEGKPFLWHYGPVRLVPLLEGCGQRYRLRFELQFQRKAFHLLDDGQKDEPWVRVQFLNLKVDESVFGRPRSETGMIHQDEESSGTYWVTWRNLQFRADGTRWMSPVVELERPMENETWIEGSLRLSVPALLSGLERVKYFNALGYPVEVRFQGNTLLNVDFRMALSSVPCVQTERREKHFTFPGEPDRERYQILGNALNCEPQSTPCRSRRSWQITQVLTEPPRIAESDATRYRWYWDITGRRYQDTLPVDFHLVLYGDDMGKLDITVQGQTFDEASRHAVERTLDELQEIVRETLLSKGGA